MTNEPELKPLTNKEKKQWKLFFQSGFYTAVAGYISSLGFKLYSLNQEKIIILVLGIYYLITWWLISKLYKDYKKEIQEE